MAAPAKAFKTMAMRRMHEGDTAADRQNSNGLYGALSATLRYDIVKFWLPFAAGDETQADVKR